ncbi:hypothetical protein N9B73_07155 [Verrucomicrobiales bacterium]|nr:hypothetical protein [Verrucomicrobiales bacterium]
MEHRHLQRLDDSAYEGFAQVHWTFSVKDRQTGWLDELFHLQFRVLLLHSLSRYEAVCPAYCLMPERLHLVIMGRSEECCQKNLVRFLRKHSNALLKAKSCEWQKQAYDNVLREKDRERDAFAKVIGYLNENPVRAGYVELWKEWDFSGCMVPGYPELDPFSDDYWDRFWRIHYP